MKIHRTLQSLIFLGIALLLIVSCTGVPDKNIPLATPLEKLQQTTTVMMTPELQTPSAKATQHPSATPTTQITATRTPAPNNAHIKTVFIIVMENHNWSDIFANPSAPYVNKTLLPQASYARQYYNPPGNHPSEPNYLWLEAGTAFGITHDSTPAEDHQSTTDHLVTYLQNAGIYWKAYEEGISGKVCPLEGTGLYIPRHNPMVYFDDVTDNNNPDSSYCIAHERPFSELKSDLQNDTVARYNFITPNLCNNMHNTDGCPTQDELKNGDAWLSEQVPMIMNSNAYKQGGVVFITWDESEGGDKPIGMIVLSAFAKGGGYSNSIHYTHSSMLRTIEEIFNVTPLLGDAASATDLSDLFTEFP